MTGWDDFKKYAISVGVHNGPSTLSALKIVYRQNKGSRYKTIVALFRARGETNILRQYNKEMGYK